MDKNMYTKKSIETLSPLEFTRLKPQIYCGSTEYSTQLLIEIVSNAIDEYNLGHGKEIEITIDNEKGFVSVRDYGQGIITNNFREDGITTLEAAFSILNTSGKYREDGTYEGTSLGSYGIGSKLCCFLSHKCNVTSYYKGTLEHITFIEGVFSNRETKKTKEKDGIYVSWNPSEEFFTHTEVELSKIKDLFNTLSCLCSGLKITLCTNDDFEVFQSKRGLEDLIDDSSEILTKRLVINKELDKYKLNLVMTYTSNYSSSIIPYVNAGLTESGPHITQLKSVLTRELNKFFKKKKWIKDENLSGEDIQEGLSIVFNYTAPNVAYDAQVKCRITKIDTKFLTKVFAEELQKWLSKNEKEIKKIADKTIEARKAREAAKKARESARGKQQKKEKVLKFSSKLADCYGKDRSKCEIIICEGDSAAGNLKMARQKDTTAILPIRGKMLNCYKASYEKIQKNAEIMTIVDALGLTFNPKTMKLVYTPKELRYGKIIIMSDADIDGSHIKNLFYTFIWSFCPELIMDGYIYAGVPPLYKITTAKGYKYLKDDVALAEYQKKNIGKKYTVNRFKGLGELSLEETEDTLINPNNRILKQITLEDIGETEQLFEDLMGTPVEPRKRFISEHSKEAQYAV
ncbi:MAG: toprim domain-containing protein [Prevotella sp.]|nr:toprim domain-containing protein [Prevotella sp.]